MATLGGLNPNRKIDVYRTTTATTGSIMDAMTTTTTGANGADVDLLTATPLETAEGSDEIRFAVIAGVVIAGGIGIWWWMRKGKKKGRSRRKSRGYLL